ncbi:hypothetical protein HNY73_007320 [Argiope bruennichi]|uniref:Uncharacterized protein n=1 Tax=Argiope bruennichi TaxID=94029 RepID=A0A8T0FJ45_ARGBR|nr:hypothetical protein HNY73_007320 [Argiope bruennichi]
MDAKKNESVNEVSDDDFEDSDDEWGLDADDVAIYDDTDSDNRIIKTHNYIHKASNVTVTAPKPTRIGCKSKKRGRGKTHPDSQKSPGSAERSRQLY